MTKRLPSVVSVDVRASDTPGIARASKRCTSARLRARAPLPKIRGNQGIAESQRQVGRIDLAGHCRNDTHVRGTGLCDDRGPAQERRDVNRADIPPAPYANQTELRRFVKATEDLLHDLGV